MRRVFPFTFIPSHKSDGTVNAGGTVWFYTAGTSTLETTFADFSLSATNSLSGVTLDSAGKKKIFLREDRMYDIVEKDSSGNTINTHYMIGQNLSAVLTDLSENVVSNHSFETDTDADGNPDNWTRTVGGGETAAVDATQDYHGTKSFKFISASGGSYLVSDPFPVSPAYTLFLSLSRYASNAAARPKVEVNWLDEAQAAISSSTLYHQTDGGTPTSWARIYGLQGTPPATARYATLTITGNTAASSYSVWVDDVRVQLRSAYDMFATSVPFGLELSQAADTDHDITISAGSVLDDAGTYSLILPSATTKRGDATWAIGTGNGGMEGGGSMPASGIVSVWLIGASGTGAVDVVFSDTTASPTMPSGYDKKRYLGSVRTDASNNFLLFRSKGAQMVFLELGTEDISDSTLTDATLETGTLDAPPSCNLHYVARIEVDTGAATDLVGLVRPYDSDWAVTFLGAGLESTTDDLDEFTWTGYVMLDSSSRLSYGIDWAGHAGTMQFHFNVIGWYDNFRMAA